MLNKLLNKQETCKCIHHWHYVGKSTVYTDNGCDINDDELNALFCPKCEGETTVNDERWAQLQEIQKVREAYHKSVEIDVPFPHTESPAPSRKRTTKKMVPAKV